MDVAKSVQQDTALSTPRRNLNKGDFAAVAAEEQARHPYTKDMGPLNMTDCLPPHQVIDGQCIFHWQDDVTEAEGWVVIDAPRVTLSGGGLFMHCDATQEEVSDVAASMTSKLAVACQPQLHGAKGGIRFPPDDPRAPGVLSRFIRHNAATISAYWGTGGDLNTTHSGVDQIVRDHGPPGTKSALDALTTGLGCRLSASTVADLLHDTVQWSPHTTDSITINQYATGYGIATALRKLLATTDLVGRASIVIQGFGSVGSAFAVSCCVHQRLGTIVAICSQEGALIDEQGIDVAALLAGGHAGATSDLRQTPNASFYGSQRLEDCLPGDNSLRGRYIQRAKGTSHEEHLVNVLRLVKADVFAPCAQRYALTRAVVTTLQAHTFSDNQERRCSGFIISGANNVMQQGLNIHLLDDARIVMPPEWISNAGAACLFVRACSGFCRPGQGDATLQDIASDIESFMDETMKGCVTGPALRSSDLQSSAHAVASRRRSRGPWNLFGVRRLAGMTLSSTDARKAHRALTTVGMNPETYRDKRILTLSSPKDPPVYICQAEASASKKSLGLSMTFAVFSFTRARAVLEQEGIAFVEKHDGIANLVQVQDSVIGYDVSLIEEPDSQIARSSETESPWAEAQPSPGARRLDHYTTIVPDAAKAREAHERLLGFTHLRTIRLNAGSAPVGHDDMLNDVMALPNDPYRVLVITQGLLTESIFSKLLQRKGAAHIHHLALQVGDLEESFRTVREKGLQTTADGITRDPLSELRQVFIKEEELGGSCFLELIERPPEAAAETSSDGLPAKDAHNGASDRGNTGGEVHESRQTSLAASQQGNFRESNMASLAQTMAEYVG